MCTYQLRIGYGPMLKIKLKTASSMPDVTVAFFRHPAQASYSIGVGPKPQQAPHGRPRNGPVSAVVPYRYPGRAQVAR